MEFKVVLVNVYYAAHHPGLHMYNLGLIDVDTGTVIASAEFETTDQLELILATEPESDDTKD